MRQRNVLGTFAAGIVLATALDAATGHGRAWQAAVAQPPAVGEVAVDFTLDRVDGQSVSLSVLRRSGPVVVLMLRGWVGYQ